MPKIETGRDVDAYCTKCKLDLAHVIVAMNGARIVRVQCKTCGGVHAYRAAVSSPVVQHVIGPQIRSRGQSSTGIGAASRLSPARPASAANASRRGGRMSAYDEAIRGQDISRARPYRTSERFAAGEIMDHRVFGVGIVTRMMGDDKLEVMFPAGSKVLVQGHRCVS